MIKAEQKSLTLHNINSEYQGYNQQLWNGVYHNSIYHRKAKRIRFPDVSIQYYEFAFTVATNKILSDIHRREESVNGVTSEH